MERDIPERDPTLAGVIDRAITARLFGVNTCEPGRIVKLYTDTDDSGNPRLLAVDVQPLVQTARLLEDDTRMTDTPPVVPHVSVLLMGGGGGFRGTCPVRAGRDDGDFCLLVYAGRSIDKWSTGKGGIVDPEIDVAHSRADAIAILGLFPFGTPPASWPTDHATFGKDGGPQIHFRDATITIGDESGADFMALAQKVLTELQRIQAHFAAVEAVLTGAPIAEPGNGAPSALQTALTVAIGISPYPGPGSVAATQGKAK